MKYLIRFPEGKKKAFTLSYDDGQIFDRRLVDLFDKYDVKATFHLNAGTLSQVGENEEFLLHDELEDLFEGHEVSCHGVHHPYFSQLNDAMIVTELLEDKRILERAVHYPVRGMSYPFGDYSDHLISIMKSLGFEYSRTVENTNDFHIPADFMKWHPSCHHNDALSMVDRFLHPYSYQNLLLFYVWGHSFEFDRENTWDMMEEFLKRISRLDDVWYATNIEIKEYVTAARSLIATADHDLLYNPSAQTIYIECGNSILSINPGTTLSLPK